LNAKQNKEQPEGTTNVSSGEVFNIPKQGYCIPRSSEPVPTPMAWPINTNQPEYSGKFLFVFHLLPQKAARIYDGNIKMTNKPPPEGTPQCIGNGNG
jgi:hypothetical protein